MWTCLSKLAPAQRGTPSAASPAGNPAGKQMGFCGAAFTGTENASGGRRPYGSGAADGSSPFQVILELPPSRYAALLRRLQTPAPMPVSCDHAANYQFD